MAKSNTVRTSVLVCVAPPGVKLRNLKYRMLIVPPSTSTNINPNTHTHTHTHMCVYRVSQEEFARLREGVRYVKLYRYNPKHLCPKLNGYGDNGQRKVWSSGGSTHSTCQLTALSMLRR